MEQDDDRDSIPAVLQTRRDEESDHNNNNGVTTELLDWKRLVDSRYNHSVAERRIKLCT